MSSLSGVVPLADLSDRSWDALEALRVRPTGGRVSRPFIQTSFANAEALAAGVSKAVGCGALAICMQTSADVYLIAEYGDGALRRKLLYERDGGGWCDPEGEPRPWERTLHFARALDAVLDDLEDAEQPPEPSTLSRLRLAFESRDVTDLPLLPRPNGESVHALLESFDVDISNGPSAKQRLGILSFLFGSR